VAVTLSKYRQPAEMCNKTFEMCVNAELGLVQVNDWLGIWGGDFVAHREKYAYVGFI